MGRCGSLNGSSAPSKPKPLPLVAALNGSSAPSKPKLGHCCPKWQFGAIQAETEQPRSPQTPRQFGAFQAETYVQHVATLTRMAVRRHQAETSATSSLRGPWHGHERNGSSAPSKPKRVSALCVVQVWRGPKWQFGAIQAETKRPQRAPRQHEMAVRRHPSRNVTECCVVTDHASAHEMAVRRLRSRTRGVGTCRSPPRPSRNGSSAPSKPKLGHRTAINYRESSITKWQFGAIQAETGRALRRPPTGSPHEMAVRRHPSRNRSSFPVPPNGSSAPAKPKPHESRSARPPEMAVRRHREAETWCPKPGRVLVDSVLWLM